MKTIHKYPLEISGRQEIRMPEDAEILHVGLDPNSSPHVWALVDTHAELQPMKFFVVGTGQEMLPWAMQHVGSFNQGPFVWHVFLF